MCYKLGMRNFFVAIVVTVFLAAHSHSAAQDFIGSNKKPSRPNLGTDLSRWVDQIYDLDDQRLSRTGKCTCLTSNYSRENNSKAYEAVVSLKVESSDVKVEELNDKCKQLEGKVIIRKHMSGFRGDVGVEGHTAHVLMSCYPQVLLK